ncbi:hypothetical protein EGW08_016935 [Elysia chlorotica]|uniref:Uncharacterized protein n=1 Tax=Elysia chlorotica TaxID=188477 RepID=A0A3S1B3N3_ELYCH|nr:hypothetical protein EGW08_016935 [Elysia chlorotica]
MYMYTVCPPVVLVYARGQVVSPLSDGSSTHGHSYRIVCRSQLGHVTFQGQSISYVLAMVSSRLWPGATSDPHCGHKLAPVGLARVMELWLVQIVSTPEWRTGDHGSNLIWSSCLGVLPQHNDGTIRKVSRPGPPSHIIPDQIWRLFSRVKVQYPSQHGETVCLEYEGDGHSQVKVVLKVVLMRSNHNVIQHLISHGRDCDRKTPEIVRMP